jgi:uncharacterized membrane protein
VSGVALGRRRISRFPDFPIFSTRNPQILAYTQRLITLTDAVFTGGGLLLMLIAGHAMTAQQPLLWKQPWLPWSYVLFALSGVIWAAILLPLQIIMAKMARAFAASGGPIPERYWELSRCWAIAGSIASLLPLASLWLMVTRP